MQSKTTNVARVPPPGELDLTYAFIFDSGPFAPLCENNVSHKTGST